MHRRLILPTSFLAFVIAVAAMLIGAPLASAQTTADSSSTLRATIETEILSDPRAQTMTQAQINSMVDALTAQAQQQGVTAQQLTYAPALAVAQPAAPATPSCTTFTCALGNAFGLNGSLPIIPIALFILAALFILIFSIMREKGHPHAQYWGDNKNPTQ